MGRERHAAAAEPLSDAGTGDLVPATKRRRGFPDIPGVSPWTTVNPVLDYDFGPGFVPTICRRHQRGSRRASGGCCRRYVPRVNADGNETSGVPSVLHQAPLGTYLGWNVTASGFFAGQGCGFAGGYLPFARTRAGREASGDPRPSLEERYGTLDGYVCVVRRAADAPSPIALLLRADADRLIADARPTAGCCLPSAESSAQARGSIADTLCR